MEQRLQKVLAAAGVGSRRFCETLITSGRIAVDGKVVTELGAKVIPGKAKLTYDGQPVQMVREKIYILLNKPVGYTSTRSDPHAKHTVLELLKGIDAYLYPVGRLDLDTSGLLLLTNDGDFTKLLTHPSHQVNKTYVAVVEGRITAANLNRLERGVKMEDGVTAPAKARLLTYSPSEGASTVEITIHEGRKRQVRRMFESMGHEVYKLSRTKLGFLDLTGLSEGKYRNLAPKEVAELKKLASPPKAAAPRPGRTPARRKTG
ncbi:MAG: pseudouridine synthase [Armatimonadetes bacterium]|nr:pseudouridine synthase [Armatimonadota bacterium]